KRCERLGRRACHAATSRRRGGVSRNGPLGRGPEKAPIHPAGGVDGALACALLNRLRIVVGPYGREICLCAESLDTSEKSRRRRCCWRACAGWSIAATTAPGSRWCPR